MGKLKPGGVLLGDSQLHLHQEDSVGGGGGSGLFLIVTSIYKLCQLSALSASILRLPEQTKTGALRLSQASKLPEQTETGATLEKGGWRRVLLAEAYLKKSPRCKPSFRKSCPLS